MAMIEAPEEESETPILRPQGQKRKAAMAGGGGHGGILVGQGPYEGAGEALVLRLEAAGDEPGFPDIGLFMRRW
jgi:hypothetical protein